MKILKLLKRVNLFLYNAQKSLVTVLFLALLGISALQLVLRLFFKSGIVNAETLTRYLVMWVAFLGGSLATYKWRHINLDVVSRSFKKLNKNLFNFIICVCACVILGVFCKASVDFIMMEMGESSKLFFIPVWVLESIIPIMFFCMFLVYLQGTLDSAAKLFGRKKTVAVNDKNGNGEGGLTK
ncbi:MAG: TRAP transporter small permease [Spirochaetia bacterium]|nr:TRAP transporter small permease [Spirochaetia bacterium]